MRKHCVSYITAAVLAGLCVCLCVLAAGCKAEENGYLLTEDGLRLTANADGWTVVGGDERAQAVAVPAAYAGLPVTEIAERAFAGCAMRKLTVGENVSAVGREAFAGCDSLADITVPAGVKFGLAPFKDCAGIENATLPVDALGQIPKKALREATVTDGRELPAYAFAGCTALGRVVLPDGMNSIGTDAFRNRPLTYLSLPASLTYAGRGAFYGCGQNAEIRFRGGLGEWCGITFGDVYANPLGCAGKAYFADAPLVDLELPAAVTAVKSCAFSGYRPLASVRFHGGVTEIGASAFYGCENLARAEMTDGVRAIGAAAFAQTGLRELALPATVSHLEASAFAGTDLAAITAAGNDAYRAEGDCLLDNATGALVLGCGDSVIPPSVTEIGAYAFAGRSVSALSLPAELKKIGGHAFYNCKDLRNLTVPRGVTEIGKAAFGNCESLAGLKFAAADGWYRTRSPADNADYAIGNLSDSFAAAKYLTDAYVDYYWRRSAGT